MFCEMEYIHLGRGQVDLFWGQFLIQLSHYLFTIVMYDVLALTTGRHCNVNQVNSGSHLGYLGGLQRSQAAKIPYYATSTREVIFHVSTQLPMDQPQQKVCQYGRSYVTSSVTTSVASDTSLHVLGSPR